MYDEILKHKGKKVGHQFTIAMIKHLHYLFSLLN